MLYGYSIYYGHPFESDRKISAKTCGLDDLVPTDGLSSDPET